MAEYRCRPRQNRSAATAALAREQAAMEAADEPMNRYISACTSTSCPTASGEDYCLARQNRILLERLVELSAQENQILLDLLGAVNSLTAALLTSRAQV